MAWSPPVFIECKIECRICKDAQQFQIKVIGENQVSRVYKIVTRHLRTHGWSTYNRKLAPKCPRCIRKGIKKKGPTMRRKAFIAHEAMRLRNEDPKYWTYKRLGDLYGVTRQAAHKYCLIEQQENAKREQLRQAKSASDQITGTVADQ